MEYAINQTQYLRDYICFQYICIWSARSQITEYQISHTSSQQLFG